MFKVLELLEIGGLFVESESLEEGVLVPVGGVALLGVLPVLWGEVTLVHCVQEVEYLAVHLASILGLVLSTHLFQTTTLLGYELMGGTLE